MLLLGFGKESWSGFTSSLPCPAVVLGMASDGCLSVLDIKETDKIFLVKMEDVEAVKALEEAGETSPRGLASGGVGTGSFPVCFPLQ